VTFFFYIGPGGGGVKDVPTVPSDKITMKVNTLEWSDRGPESVFSELQLQIANIIRQTAMMSLSL
jgi:hypothetical protein